MRLENATLALKSCMSYRFIFFTCSKLTIETLEQGFSSVNKKNTRTRFF